MYILTVKTGSLKIGKLRASLPDILACTAVFIVLLPICDYLQHYKLRVKLVREKYTLGDIFTFLSVYTFPTAKLFDLAASSSWKLCSTFPLPITFLKRVYSCIVVGSLEEGDPPSIVHIFIISKITVAVCFFLFLYNVTEIFNKL